MNSFKTLSLASAILLVNALLYYCSSLSDINSPADGDDITCGALFRPGIVHRLDKETSGLIIVAKDNKLANEEEVERKNQLLPEEIDAEEERLKAEKAAKEILP